MTEPTESEEWIDELVDRWTEVYKKSMTTLVLLRVVRDIGPADASAIEPGVARATGWSLTERGVYRTIRRLASSGLLSTHELPAPRTGAKRKVYELTALGLRYLQRIEAETIAVSTKK